MAKVIKYSKEEFLKYLKLLKNDVYLYFYDLDTKLFDKVVTDFSKLISDMKIIKLSSAKGDKLVLLGKLICNLMNELIEKLDNLDIGEFDIVEFNKESELPNLLNEFEFLSYVKDETVKSIYINKDEQVIQLYNFSI